MTLKTIKAGAQPNDGTGDNLRTGAQIINENFAELDNRTSDAASQINTINNKLSTVEAGATKNRPDAELLARTSHTGTQLAATISNFSPAVKAILQGNGLADYVKEIPEVQLNGLLANSFVYVTPDGTGAIPFQTSTFYVIHMTHPNTAYAVQIAVSAGQGKQYSRFKAGGSWSQWNSNLIAGDYGVGAWALQAPVGNTIDARVPAGLYGFGPAYGGAPSPTASGEYINLQGSIDAKRATQLAFSHDTDEMWFRRDTSGWQPWKKLLMQGNFGVGSTSLEVCADANVVAASGTLLIHPGTANSPGVYGTLATSFYDKGTANWTQLALASTGNGMFYRGCVNGGIQPWMRVNEEFIANANGSAIKFSDGTMICWGGGSTLQTTSNQAAPGIFLGNAEILTFPIPFASIGGVTASVAYSANAYCWGAVGEGNNPTQCRVIGISHAANAQYYARYTAVGRWR